MEVIKGQYDEYVYGAEDGYGDYTGKFWKISKRDYGYDMYCIPEELMKQLDVTVDSDEIAEDFFSKVDALEPQKIDMIENNDDYSDADMFYRGHEGREIYARDILSMLTLRVYLETMGVFEKSFPEPTQRTKPLEMKEEAAEGEYDTEKILWYLENFGCIMCDPVKDIHISLNSTGNSYKRVDRPSISLQVMDMRHDCEIMSNEWFFNVEEDRKRAVITFYETILKSQKFYTQGGRPAMPFSFYYFI